MNKPARKPLRRTAWSLFLGGLGVTALMLGIGALVVSKGESTAPDRAATWPAGTEIAIERQLGRQQDNAEYEGNKCTVTPRGGRPTTVWPTWGVRMRPDFEGSATITCEIPAKVLTGSAITVAGITRGSLIAVPLVSVCLGILFFFPRFTALWASLSHPLWGACHAYYRA